MADLRAFGIDVSRWDEKFDWDMAVDKLGVVFGAARASISWGYQDAWFPRNWAEMKRKKILRFAYYVIYGGEDPIRQADNFLRVVGDDWDCAFPVNDIEVRSVGPQQYTATAMRMNEKIEKESGRKPVMYGSPVKLDEILLPGAWRKEHDWWIAHYLVDRSKEMTSPPRLPKDVATYLIHQTSDMKPTPAGLSPKKCTDTNRWNGDALAVLGYAGLAGGDVPPPVPPVQLPRYVTVTVSRANIREKPNQFSADLGDTYAGDTWPVLGIELVDGETWYKIGGYIAGWIVREQP